MTSRSFAELAPFKPDTDTNYNNTQPITNLTAAWVENVGVTLNWTAATDVTEYSQYEVYYLNTSSLPAVWISFVDVDPMAVKSPKSPVSYLIPPATTYFVPWAQLVAWATAGAIPSQVINGVTTPTGVALRVQHIDSLGSESDWTSTFVFPPAISATSIPGHFPNSFELDTYGQLMLNGQDTLAEINDSVSMLLGSAQGQRNAVPSYGLPDLPFSNINPADIQTTIKYWEPRANTDVSVILDDNGSAYLNVTIQPTSGE